MVAPFVAPFCRTFCRCTIWVKVGGVKVGVATVGGAKVGGAKVGGAKVGGAKVGGVGWAFCCCVTFCRNTLSEAICTMSTPKRLTK